MRLTELGLTHFRNYRALTLPAIPPGFLLVQGENAQGKTNLLEAIYTLGTTRSPRTRRDSELIAWDIPQDGTAATRIVGTIQSRQRTATLELVLAGHPEPVLTQASDAAAEFVMSPQRGARRRLLLNGVAKRPLDWLGSLTVVLFRPEDLDLITGAPAARRRLLDILLSQTDRTYARTLQRYTRALVQRNHLLRRIAERRAGADELNPWDEVVAREGGPLLERRALAVDRLSGLAAAFLAPLSGDRDRLTAAYVATAATTEEAVTAAGPDALLARLRSVRPRDLALGQTTVGPHRDDIAFAINGAPAAAFGSRGQQRTLGLAWKLAEAGYLREVGGEDPVLLLDDVFSELDERRRRLVQAVVAGYEQVFATTTGAEALGDAPAPSARFEVRQGAVTPLGPREAAG